MDLTSIDVNVLVMVPRCCRKRRIRTVRPTRWHRNGEEDQLRDLQTAVQEKADEESVLRVPERPLTPIPSSSCVPESRPPVSLPQSGLRSRSLPNISPGAERVRGTNAQERRPITPSGTGTIVIVQVVVHTSDSTSQRLSPGASRPAPSAPSVRTPGDMLSHPPSRASTVQHSDNNSHSHSNSDHGHIDDDNSESHDESSSEDESETKFVAIAATAASLANSSTEPLLLMAQALNLVLGSSPDAQQEMDYDVQSPDDCSEELDNASGDDQRSERSLAPEGSFERFLTRIRNAWDRIRDRFSRSGRNRRTDVPREDNDVTEAQLMQQMAQALGSSPAAQQEINTDVQSLDVRSEELDNSSGDDQRSERSLTPEGSFERFLHNLQDDLRTALVVDYAARRARATVSHQESGQIL
ncbi:hypothetical protein M422DRAFT_267628 [Sphaerobolus stellatus SS14]|uniref:Uncharacterized protein n=1 Tax=Sphaerobolus stellatus (strain SS14) TaxID=990650 RepID=A0A0C9U8L7_SPHS4|nr:hypothetical protein M422DRAFT_267628 [Sphaerobolus stellatus SS14]